MLQSLIISNLISNESEMNANLPASEDFNLAWIQIKIENVKSIKNGIR
jgi:hypothetical protein